MPIDFASLTPENLATACESAMRTCDEQVARIAAIPAAERTYANTLLALEEAIEPVSIASGAYAFMAYVTPNDALREAAREWDEKLDKYMVALSFREDLYNAVKEAAAKPEAAALTGEDARYLQFELRDYRRNGFELPPEERAEVRSLFDRLVELGTQFRNAIDDWDDGIDVLRDDLAGMPPSWIDSLKTVEAGGQTRYRVSLDYPEIQPFMANAEREDLRRELFTKDQCKGGPENVARLEEAIAVRQRIAALLGYDSWAAYVVEVRMAKRRQAVDEFLSDLRSKLAAKMAADMDSLRAARREHSGGDELNIWDWRFYHNQIGRAHV